MNQLTEDQKQRIQFWCSEIEQSMRVGDDECDAFISLREQYDEKDWLSHKQIDSLKRMYEDIVK